MLHKIDHVLSIPQNVTYSAPALGLTAAAGAVNATGLAETLDTAPDLTLFVPSNAALQAAGSAFAGASIDTLRGVLQYHAVLGNVLFSTEASNTTVQAANCGTLTITVVNGTVFVNGAKVIVPNYLLSNGVAHVIDQ